MLGCRSIDWFEGKGRHWDSSKGEDTKNAKSIIGKGEEREKFFFLFSSLQNSKQQFLLSVMRLVMPLGAGRGKSTVLQAQNMYRQTTSLLTGRY